MTSTTSALVRVAIISRGVAHVSGPGFHGCVGVGSGPRSALNRPTYGVTLIDDTQGDWRPPMPVATRALRKGFPAAACALARLLAAHYGVTDAVITVDDHTDTYTLPED